MSEPSANSSTNTSEQPLVYIQGSSEPVVMSGQGWGLEFYDCVVNNDLAKMELLAEQHKIDLNAKFTEVKHRR